MDSDSRTIHRAYLTAGGDLDNKTGKELFRLDIENHGLTAAFITGYCVQFCELKGLLADPARTLAPTVSHRDGISPNGSRKNVPTQIEKPTKADAVYGAVWYRDIFGGEHVSRFILRISATRDVPGHGLTRIDVGDVPESYWERT